MLRVRLGRACGIRCCRAAGDWLNRRYERLEADVLADREVHPPLGQWVPT